MGISIKEYTIDDFYADQIDVIINSAVITNVVIKRVHCVWEVFNTCMHELIISISLMVSHYFCRSDDLLYPSLIQLDPPMLDFQEQ